MMMDISTNDERFGLPLSLVEALQADTSRDAALLAGYLTGALIEDDVAVDPPHSLAAVASPLAAGPEAGGMRSEILSLEQLLRDPLIRLVMASDDVRDDDVRGVMRHARSNKESAGRSIDRLAA